MESSLGGIARWNAFRPLVAVVFIVSPDVVVGFLVFWILSDEWETADGFRPIYSALKKRCVMIVYIA